MSLHAQMASVPFTRAALKAVCASGLPGMAHLSNAFGSKTGLLVRQSLGVTVGEIARIKIDVSLHDLRATPSVQPLIHHSVKWAETLFVQSCRTFYRLWSTRVVNGDHVGAGFSVPVPFLSTFDDPDAVLTASAGAAATSAGAGISPAGASHWLERASLRQGFGFFSSGLAGGTKKAMVVMMIFFMVRTLPNSLEQRKGRDV